MPKRISLVPVTMAVISVATAPGCSFIFTEGPPPMHEQMPFFDCSTSYAPPVLDTIWGGLNLLGAVDALGKTDADFEGTSYDRDTVIGVGLAWVAISTASAIYGYSKVGACKEAKDALMMRSVRPPGQYPGQPYAPGAPGGYPPPRPQSAPPPAAAPPPPPPPPPPSPMPASKDGADA